MSSKSKGVNAERELIHKFWANGWVAHRIAGSGSSKYPSADIIASNKLRRLAVECKTSAENNKYIDDEQIDQLRVFANLFGAEPWIAVKFNREDWLFLALEDIGKSGKNYVINLEEAKMKGLLFDEVVK